MPELLVDAVRMGRESQARHMLATDSYGYIDQQGPRGDGTALYWAACHNYVDIAEILLVLGANPDALTVWNSSPLHAACDNNRLDMARLLLQAGCDVNSQTMSGDTPCHLAAYRGYSEIVQVLVEHGASLEMVNKKNRNIYIEARNGSHKELVRYLQAVYNLAGVRTTPVSPGLSLPCALKDLHKLFPTSASESQSQCEDWNRRSGIPIGGIGSWTQNFIIENDLSLSCGDEYTSKMSFRNL